MRLFIAITFLLSVFYNQAVGQADSLISFNKDFLLGKIDYAKDERFVKLSSNICTKENAYLLKEVRDSLESMINAAKKEGISFMVISASRNFNQQKAIWEKKWTDRKQQFPDETKLAQNILLYSSMPGTSRHHWGTDFDLNSLKPQYFNQGKGKLEYDWLIKNAHRFGFYQPYNNDEKRTGYQEEKWHWSFYPISSVLTNSYIDKIQYGEIGPFLGSTFAEKLSVIENYVQGIQAPPHK